MVRAAIPGHSPIGEASCQDRVVLKAISPETQSELLKRSQEMRLPKGHVLFRQGELHRTTHFILRGLIKAYYLSPLGKAMTLAFFSEGDMMGGPEFLAELPHIWSASTVKDSVVLAVPVADLDRLVNQYPDLARYVIRALTSKVQWLSGLLQISCTESVTDRLAHLLVRLGEMYGIKTEKGIVITQEFSQEELANMVGASRPWVNLTLKRLQCAHLISSAGRHIILRDVEGLKQNGLIALCGRHKSL